ncbi:MAG: hypothetical protein QM811_14525 [Pirellulales bacterium]
MPELPLTTTIEPTTHDASVAAVRAAVAENSVIYPLGGRTALDRGLLARVPGIGVSTRRIESCDRPRHA